jgi:hypothetical protein
MGRLKKNWKFSQSPWQCIASMPVTITINTSQNFHYPFEQHGPTQSPVIQPKLPIYRHQQGPWMGHLEKNFEILPITLAMHCQHASNHNNKHLTEFSLAVWTT